MAELAQCYNVLPQLDINNTIDHRPEGDEKWFLENEKTVTQFCRKLAAERPLKHIRDEYNYPKKKGIKDECSRLLEASTMKSDRKSGSAGMPRPISYAVFCLKKKNNTREILAERDQEEDALGGHRGHRRPTAAHRCKRPV